MQSVFRHQLRQRAGIRGHQISRASRLAISTAERVNISFTRRCCVGPLLSRAKVSTGVRTVRERLRGISHVAASPLPRGQHAEPPALAVGAVHDGFSVKRVVDVDDFHMRCFLLKHVRTGADYLHCFRADTDNAFMVSFHTPEANSTGVAHILEHTTLCGSQRYPVRDPFFHMIKRSLKTFMNAMTAQEFTMYPFSTQNPADYSNLLNVYLDAVFRPLLRETDFRQEGHRLAFEVPNDPSSPLTIQGVVYNEMKGCTSDSASVFYRKFRELMFPDPSNPWHHESGGLPSQIPQLTYQQLKNFHSLNYHPSNALFVSYGDLPPPLSTVDAYLKEFSLVEQEARRLERKRAMLTPAQEARVVEVTGPEDPMAVDPEKNCKVSVSYMCNVVAETVKDTVALSVLESLLLDGPAAPMYEALIESSLGSGYAPVSGYDATSRQATLSFGLQGIRRADVDQVTQLIQSTLERVAVEGFPQERVDAYLHVEELNRRAVSTGFGLNVAYGVASFWAQDGDVLEPLRSREHIEWVKEQAKNRSFFPDLVKKYCLENSHKLTLIMTAVPGYSETEQAAERKAFEASVASAVLTDQQKQREIIEFNRILAEEQERKPNVDCLPTLSVSDIDGTVETTRFESLPSGTLLAEQPTNGVGYFRGIWNCASLDQDLRPYLPVFFSLLGKTGTKSLSHREFAHQMELRTGAVSLGHSVLSDPRDVNRIQETVVLAGSALSENSPYMFDLMRQLIMEPMFDDSELILTLLNAHAAGLAESLHDSGALASLYSASPLTPAMSVAEFDGGISQTRFFNGLVAQCNADPKALRGVVEKCERIASHLRSGGLGRSLLTGDASTLESMSAVMPSFMEKIPSVATGAMLTSPGLVDQLVGEAQGRLKSFFGLPTEVNYTAMSLKTVPYTHKDFPALILLAEILTSCFLHQQVREKGGAYGASATAREGIFSFSSFRDPNLQSTFDTFRASRDWLHSADALSRANIEQGLLVVFSNINAPFPPQEYGLVKFDRGIRDAERQELRTRLLGLSRDDLLETAERYLSEEALASAPVAVIGNQSETPEESGWAVRSLMDLHEPEAEV